MIPSSIENLETKSSNNHNLNTIQTSEKNFLFN